ncbi:MAG: phospholipid carrier-dependent glycosyltransferase [bacterium]|nr:phospholipid carrier-dependent glycosyltransferase [bacterium]
MEGRLKPLGRRGWGMLLLILVFAGCLRGWRLGEPAEFACDEMYYVPAAYTYVVGTHDTNELHPPMGKILIADGMRLGLQLRHLGFFVLNSACWRITPLLCGLGVVALTFFLAYRLSQGSLVVAELASFLVASDFLSITMSRLAMLDMVLSFWILLGSWFACLYIGEDESKQKSFIYILACFCSFGVAVAVKWSALCMAGTCFVFLCLGYRKKLSRGGAPLVSSETFALPETEAVSLTVATPAVLSPTSSGGNDASLTAAELTASVPALLNSETSPLTMAEPPASTSELPNGEAVATASAEHVASAGNAQFVWAMGRLLLLFAVIIACIYTIAYVPQFLREGFNYETLNNIFFAYYRVLFMHLNPKMAVNYNLAPCWAWPLGLIPMLVFAKNNAVQISSVTICGSIVFWWFGGYQTLKSLFVGWRFGDTNVLFTAFMWLSSWLFWILSIGGFLFYLLPGIPFMAVATAEALERLVEAKKHKLVGLYLLLLGSALALYYPLLTYIPISNVFMHRLVPMWLVDFLELFRQFFH